MSQNTDSPHSWRQRETPTSAKSYRASSASFSLGEINAQQRDAMNTQGQAAAFIRSAGELPGDLREVFKIRTDARGWVIVCKRCTASWLLTIASDGAKADGADLARLREHAHLCEGRY